MTEGKLHTSESPRIALYYHCYLAPGWETLVREQLATLTTSGLYDRADQFTVGLSGREADKQRFIQRCIANEDSEPAKLRLLTDPEHDARFEYKTLLALHQDARSKTFDIAFYFHTKGVTRVEPTVRDWRLYLEYFLLERWQAVVEALRGGYSLYGVNWIEAGSTGGEHSEIAPPHFAGNFFAARADYLRILPPPPLDADFAAYEFWVGQNIGKSLPDDSSNAPTRLFCAHQSGVNHYFQPYPPEWYRSRKT